MKYSTLIQHPDKYTHIFTVINTKPSSEEIFRINHLSKAISKMKKLKPEEEKTLDSSKTTMRITTQLTNQHKFKRINQIFSFEIDGVLKEITNLITELPLDIDNGLKKKLLGKKLYDSEKKIEIKGENMMFMEEDIRNPENLIKSIEIMSMEKIEKLATNEDKQKIENEQRRNEEIKV